MAQGRNRDTLWFSYVSESKMEVYNATAKIGKFYAQLYKIKMKTGYLIIVRKI